MDADLTPDNYRLAIAERALRLRVELGEVVVSNILEELPEYASGRSPGEMHDIRVGIQQSVDFCLITLQRGFSVQPEEYHLLRCTGAQRARQGISKAAMQASVKIAVRVGRRFLLTCSDVGDDPRAVMEAFRQVSDMLDRFEDEAVAALSEGHEEAWRQVLSAGDRGEAVLVDRLLERRFEDEEEVLAHAADIGLNRQRHARLAVVACVSQPDHARLRATAADARPLAVTAVGPVCGGSYPHLPFVVQARDAVQWTAIAAQLSHAADRHGTTVVWWEVPEPLTSLSAPYRSLCEALPFLAAVTTRPGVVRALLIRFHRIMHVGPAGARDELAAEILEPLLALPDRERHELVDFLDALYETGGSAAALARHLHVHKNTIGNRVRRVGEVLGLDVRRPADRLVLETALRMRKVAVRAPGTAGASAAPLPEWRGQHAG